MPAGDEEPSTDRSPPVDAQERPDRNNEADATTDGAPSAREHTDEEWVGPAEGAGGRREVVVPESLYRVVTVFSTLLSVLFVVLGFVVLDAATTVLSNPPASPVVRLLALAGPSVARLSTYSSTIAMTVGLLGLAFVVAGAGVYVYGSRFRAPGMGKPKDEAEEESGDG
jgi:hypothetical protein